MGPPKVNVQELFQICTQELSLAVLRGQYGMPGFKPRPIAVLSLQPKVALFRVAVLCVSSQVLGSDGSNRFRLVMKKVLRGCG